MTIDVFNDTDTLTLFEVADQLRVNILTVRRWHHDGLKAVKYGNRTVTTMDEVNAFLNSQKPAKTKKVAATVADIENLIK
tara:strand:- start:607 stop:846 length:240 start_codon:yes stop_codon:yes gene_type:complete